MSLQAKWLGALLIVGAVPLLLLSKLGLDIQRRWLEQTERALEAAVVDEASENVSGVLDDLEAATDDVGHALTDSSVDDNDTRIALARRAVAHATALDYVAIYTADGTFVDAVAAGSSRKEVSSPLSIDPNSVGEGNALMPVAFGTHGADLFWVTRMTVDERVIGFALGRVDPAKLADRLIELSNARFAHPDRITLVDDRLRSIAGGASIAGAQVPELSALGSALPTEGIAKTFPFVNRSNEPMVGTIRTIPRRHLGVFVARPESEAFAAIDEARKAFLVASLGLVVIALGAGAWLARRTTKPILSLVELTKRYAKREFTARAGVRTGDEVEDLATSMEGMAQNLKEGEEEIARRAAVESNLSRYMPEEVARSIAEGKGVLALGGRRGDVSVIFADVAGFTTFAERTPPEQVVAFLNELFTVLSEVVFRHGGMVDKFMGDCVMAVFGANGETDHALKALSAAEDMQRFVEASAPAWKETHDFDVSLGIGVATGAAIVGNLGSEIRMEYTAIGDIVNVASRLEGLARPGQTLVTLEVVTTAGDRFAFRSLGGQSIRGKREPIEIFELTKEDE